MILLLSAVPLVHDSSKSISRTIGQSVTVAPKGNVLLEDAQRDKFDIKVFHNITCNYLEYAMSCSSAIL